MRKIVCNKLTQPHIINEQCTGNDSDNETRYPKIKKQAMFYPTMTTVNINNLYTTQSMVLEEVGMF